MTCETKVVASNRLNRPLTTSLYELAYFGNPWDAFDILAALALPEPWRFKGLDYTYKNPDTPILERYLLSVYRHLALCYEGSKCAEEAEWYIWLTTDRLCFNTGLMTPKYKYIYAYFECNPRLDSLLPWKWRAFVDEASPLLKYICPLPGPPQYYAAENARCFDAQKEIRIHSDHILDDEDNIERIPEPLRSYPNLSLLLEAGIEKSRRMAHVCPGVIAHQSYRGQLQHLMPIYLCGESKPDLALTLFDESGYYLGSTCLTLSMAYINARLIGRPVAPWLRELVE